MKGPQLLDLFWILSLGTLAAGAVFLSRKRYGAGISPLSVFVAVNSLSLATYHLRLAGLYTVSADTHLVVLLSLGCFAIGCLVVPFPAAASAPRRADWDRGLRAFFHLVGLLSLAGWTTALGILLQRHGVATLLANPWILQDQFQMHGLGYLNLVGILCLPAYVALRAGGTAKRRDLLLVVSALTGLLLAGIKSFVFFSAAGSLLVLSVLRPRLPRLRHLLCALAAGLGFFVLYDHVVDVFVLSPEHAGFPAWLGWLERPYSYVVGSWPAMDQVLRGGLGRPPVPGYVVLQPVWKVLGDGLGWVRPTPEYFPFVDIGGTVWNVFSFAGEVFWDLGPLGVAVVSFLVGLGATVLYTRARRGGTWVAALAYGVFAYGLVLSFFAYYYRFGLVVLLVVVLAGGKVLRARGLDRESLNDATA